jgi:hypothetical protein
LSEIQAKGFLSNKLDSTCFSSKTPKKYFTHPDKPIHDPK